MIADAVDAAVTLGWALAVWIVLLAVAAGVAVYAVVVTAAWPCVAAWEALSAALAASRALRALPEHQNLHRAAHAPSWAQPEQEAA